MLLELVIDVLWPSRGAPSLERRFQKSDDGKLAVEFRVPGAFKRSLNESGWLADEVVAAGLLRQGKEPSLLGLVTGLALIEVLRPRRSKTLPREFVLAVTADKVVAFVLGVLKEGDGTAETVVVKIKPGERGSWPRELVRLIEGGKSKCGMLELSGVERIPVAWDGDDSSVELIELLSR